MACVSPMRLLIKGIPYTVPCGGCLPCRIAYQTRITFACECELQSVYARGSGASFVALTYADASLPIGDCGFPTLRRRDVQLFLKNIRRQIDYHGYNFQFKSLYAGEYGDDGHRPHYHFIFLGLTDVAAKLMLGKCWPKGFVDIGPLLPGGIRYVCKYCVKQLKGVSLVETFDEIGIERPFLQISARMGYDYIVSHLDEWSSRDYTYMRRGRRAPIPQYYRKLFFPGVASDLTYVRSAIHSARKDGVHPSEYLERQARLQEKAIVARLRADGVPLPDSLIYH